MRRLVLGPLLPPAALAVLAALAACSDTQDFRTGDGSPSGDEAGAPPDASRTLPSTSPDAGKLVAVELAHGQGLSADDPDRQGAWTLVTDGTWVSWIDIWSHVARVPKSGGKVQDLADTDGSPAVLALAGDHLYFTNVPMRRIERIAKGGGAIEPVTPSYSDDEWRDVQQIALDKGGTRLTWVDGKRALRCETVPCTQPSQIADLGLDPTSQPLGVAVFGTHVFVPYLPLDPQHPGQLLPSGGITVPREGGQVAIMPLDYSSVLGDVEPTNAQLTAVFATSEHLIVRADWPGNVSPRVLASGDDADMYPGPLLDGGAYLYWLTRGSSCAPCKTVTPGVIMRVKKDGSDKPEIVYQADAALHGLAIDADTLFFSTTDGRVMKLPRPGDGRLH